MKPKLDTRGKRVTLKDLAASLELSTATVSLVLNRSPVADSIPAETHERVFAAARAMRYRPNHLARSLRNRRTRTIGVLVPEIVEPYAAGVMSGVEDHLIQAGYFYLVASHRSKPDLFEEYVELLTSRQVEGMIVVATLLDQSMEVPTVAVSGHLELPGVTNVVLDHDHAAELAFEHLLQLGHRKIALFKGQPGNSDTEARWQGILDTAGKLGVEVDDDLCFQLVGDPTGVRSRTEQAYREGYDFAQQLLDNGRDFTALFAFNDVSAIGASRAFVEGGLRVPEDVSVIGFDDILSAAFHNPGLTTVRQPLSEMGATAGRILLDRLSDPSAHPGVVTVEPELVVRGSTAVARRRGN